MLATIQILFHKVRETCQLFLCTCPYNYLCQPELSVMCVSFQVFELQVVWSICAHKSTNPS